MKGKDVDADTSPQAYFSLLSPPRYISNRLAQLVWMRLGKLRCTRSDRRTAKLAHAALPKVPDPGEVQLAKWLVEVY